MRKSTIIKVIFVSMFLFFIMNTLVMAQIYYDSSGNVGIGTTEPNYNLEIKDSSNTNLALTNPGGQGNSLIWWKDSSGGNDFYLGQTEDNGNLKIYNYAASEYSMIIQTNGAIQFNGNVGIGTTDPGAALHVKGSTIKLQENTTNAGANFQFVRSLDGVARNMISTIPSGTSGKFDLVFGTDSSQWRDIYLRTDGVNNGLVLKAISGNVGIGTTDPAHLFVTAGGRGLFYRIDTDGSCAIGRQGTVSDGDILGSCEFSVVNGSGSISTYARIEGIAEDVTPIGGAIRFSTKNISWYERMRITKEGRVGIGETDPGSYELYVDGDAYSTVGWSSGSDERWKKNVEPLKDSLEKVNQLQGISFEWKINEYPDQGFTEGRYIGLIAQKVEEVIPEIVNTNDDGYKSVSYEKLTAVLVEAIKELKAENENLKKEIDLIKEIIGL